MNTFLEVLAARSSGTPVGGGFGLRPRVAGWFEPPPGGLAASTAPELEIAAEQATEPRPAPSSIPVTAEPQGAAPRPSQALEGTGARAPESGAPEPAVLVGSAPRSPAPDAVAHQIAGTVFERPAGVSGASGTAPAPAGMNRAPTLTDAPTTFAEPQRPARSEPEPNEIVVQNAEVPEPEAPEVRGTETALAPAHERGTLVPRAAPALVAPSVPRAPDNPRSEAPRAAAAPAAPVIHITIGRVEVKAAVPAAPAAPARPAAPRSALQDYLRARHEGTR